MTADSSPAFSLPPDEQPLGIRQPLLPTTPLGASLLQPKFLTPLGDRSLTVLDPGVFSSSERSAQTDWQSPFQDSPFFDAPPSPEARSLEAPSPAIASQPSIQRQPLASPELSATLPTPDFRLPTPDSPRLTPDSLPQQPTAVSEPTAVSPLPTASLPTPDSPLPTSDSLPPTPVGGWSEDWMGSDWSAASQQPEPEPSEAETASFAEANEGAIAPAMPAIQTKPEPTAAPPVELPTIQTKSEPTVAPPAAPPIESVLSASVDPILSRASATEEPAAAPGPLATPEPFAEAALPSDDFEPPAETAAVETAIAPPADTAPVPPASDAPAIPAMTQPARLPAVDAPADGSTATASSVPSSAIAATHDDTSLTAVIAPSVPEPLAGTDMLFGTDTLFGTEPEETAAETITPATADAPAIARQPTDPAIIEPSLSLAPLPLAADTPTIAEPTIARSPLDSPIAAIAPPVSDIQTEFSSPSTAAPTTALQASPAPEQTATGESIAPFTTEPAIAESTSTAPTAHQPVEEALNFTSAIPEAAAPVSELGTEVAPQVVAPQPEFIPPSKSKPAIARQTADEPVPSEAPDAETAIPAIVPLEPNTVSQSTSTVAEAETAIARQTVDEPVPSEAPDVETAIPAIAPSDLVPVSQPASTLTEAAPAIARKPVEETVDSFSTPSDIFLPTTLFPETEVASPVTPPAIAAVTDVPAITRFAADEPLEPEASIVDSDAPEIAILGDPLPSPETIVADTPAIAQRTTDPSSQSASTDERLELAPTIADSDAPTIGSLGDPLPSPETIVADTPAIAQRTTDPSSQSASTIPESTSQPTAADPFTEPAIQRKAEQPALEPPPAPVNPFTEATALPTHAPVEPSSVQRQALDSAIASQAAPEALSSPLPTPPRSESPTPALPELPTVLQGLSVLEPLAQMQPLATAPEPLSMPSVSQTTAPLETRSQVEAIAPTYPSEQTIARKVDQTLSESDRGNADSNGVPSEWSSMMELLPRETADQRETGASENTLSGYSDLNLYPETSAPPTIQREPDTAAPTTPVATPTASTESAQPPSDSQQPSSQASPEQLERLAQQIYRQVLQRLALERERVGYPYSGRF